MRVLKILAAALLATASSAAWADLEIFKDYEPSEYVYNISTVRVDSNMEDAYLEGIANTWAKAVQTQKELGFIEDWMIWRSQLSEAGDFNLMLIVKMKSLEDMQPSKERYEAFMEEFTKSQADQNTEFAQTNYPAMREITGNYIMREITLK